MTLKPTATSLPSVAPDAHRPDAHPDIVVGASH